MSNIENIGLVAYRFDELVSAHHCCAIYSLSLYLSHFQLGEKSTSHDMTFITDGLSSKHVLALIQLEV